MYRDLSPRKLLLDRDGKLKLAGTGCIDGDGVYAWGYADHAARSGSHSKES